jgi:hypothetical protein
MTLLIALREKFTNEEDGPLLNELLEVLHFMGVDEAQKAAFCEQVVKREGRKFLQSYAKVSARRFKNGEERFTTLARFLESKVPPHLRCSASV